MNWLRIARLAGILTVLSAVVPKAASADTFNIEIDYMGLSGSGGHTHEPSPGVIEAVVQAFACQGHTLNIVVDDILTHNNAIVRNPASCTDSLWTYDDGTFASFGHIRDGYFDHDGVAGWYYCVFAHNFQDNSCTTVTNSGVSNGGNCLIVSLGSFTSQVGTPFDQAATLMHEFGHNLGLAHCGTQNCSDASAADFVGDFVPNMPSVMSYRYQLKGVRTNLICNGLAFNDTLFKDIDYSPGRMCSLDEDNLNEFFGSGMIFTDWNCDSTLQSGLAYDVNGDNTGRCGSTGNLSSVSDYNEWANLSPGARLVAAAQSGDPQQLRAANYRFVDAADREALGRLAEELVAAGTITPIALASIRAGAPDALRSARVLTIDPGEPGAVQRIASEILEARRTRLEQEPCISADDLAEMRSDGTRGYSCGQPTLVTESCISGENVYVGTEVCILGFCFQFGTCLFPYDSVQTAHDVFPTGSVFYLEPKTYDEAGTVFLDKRGLWTCEREDGSGSAVIR